MSERIDTMTLLLEGAARMPLLTADEEIEFARRIEEGDRAARERLITSNLRLVVWVAKRYQRSGIALADLVQEGVLGLMRAVDLYDWRLGNRFSTYAIHWIRQRVQRAVDMQGPAIRVPGYFAERMRAVDRLEAELTMVLGRTPSEKELAAGADLRVGELRRMQDTPNVDASLDTALGDGGGSLGALTAIADVDVERDVASGHAAAELRRRVGELPGRQRAIIEMRYGFEDGEPHTLAEIGERLGLSRERIRQLEQRALQQLARQRGLAELRLAG